MRQQISSLNAIYNRDRRILALERGNSEKETRIYRLTTYIAIIAALGLALLFYLFTRRNKRHKREQKMMAKIIDLRKESLRNRVTPHFIYNALNRELNNTQKGNPSHMDALVRLIRRQQFAASEITVTLGAELDFVNDYITVSGGTPEYGVEYKLAIEPGIDPPTIPFPSMALQILVENAFKHGFRSLPTGETGILEIRIYKTGSGDTAVEVDNNRGPGCVSPRESGTGLRVLMESIRLFNEINKTKLTFTIDTDTTAGGRSGCRAVITIPGA